MSRCLKQLKDVIKTKDYLLEKGKVPDTLQKKICFTEAESAGFLT